MSFTCALPALCLQNKHACTRLETEERITPLSGSDVQDLHGISNTFVGLSLPQLTSKQSPVHKQLVQQVAFLHQCIDMLISRPQEHSL